MIANNRVFFVAATLLCLGVWMNVVGFAEAGYNPNSYPMLLANPQHNGLVANATALDNSTITVAWVFTEPDKDEFREAPVYSADDNAVYVASYTGFVYSVDANTGKQIWESCIGTPPKFPGDPCDNSGIDADANYPFGQPTLLSTGNVIILRSAEGKFEESMVCLDKATGSIVWTYGIPEYYHFYSSPTPIPQPAGGDAILIWVSSYDAMTYTVINGTTGAVIAQNQYPNMASDEMIAAMSLDPVDGNVITQWIDITDGCGDDYPQFMGCTGIGKFETLTGNHIWNSSMEDSWTNGMVAVDPVRDAIYVTGNQMDAYAYKLDTGAPLWKASQVVFATADMGWSSVCADGTVIIIDISGAINAFDPTPERVMQTKWTRSFNPPISKGVTTLPDNTFVYTVGNAVLAANCTNGNTLWVEDFGDTDRGEAYMIAVTPIGVFANVYWPGKGTGMLVRITDAGSK